MAEMGEMEMPLPDNTVPMMTGQGPHGPLEMGGMFTVVKVRKDHPVGDYNDPGWYRQPENSMAHEWAGQPTAALVAPPQSPSAGAQPAIEIAVRKPTGHSGH
jgi:hypothetical protein